MQCPTRGGRSATNRLLSRGLTRGDVGSWNFLATVYREEDLVPKCQSSASVLLVPESVRRINATARVPCIGDLFRISQRYMRSVHLERDFDNTPRCALRGNSTIGRLLPIVEGLRWVWSPGVAHHR